MHVAGFFERALKAVRRRRFSGRSGRGQVRNGGFFQNGLGRLVTGLIRNLRPGLNVGGLRVVGADVMGPVMLEVVVSVMIVVMVVMVAVAIAMTVPVSISMSISMSVSASMMSTAVVTTAVMTAAMVATTMVSAISMAAAGKSRLGGAKGEDRYESQSSERMLFHDGLLIRFGPLECGSGCSKLSHSPNTREPAGK